jgi:hypothetical protein
MEKSRGRSSSNCSIRFTSASSSTGCPDTGWTRQPAVV